MAETLIWYLFAGMTVVSASVVAFNRNVVRCGFGLLFALLGVCAMYAFMGADFLAATQVVVYVGGILVLVLFAVMMTHRIQPASLKDELVMPFAALGTALVVFVLSVLMIFRTAWPLVEQIDLGPTTARMGKGFLTDFLFPFEFASVLLLVAMMGAALIIRDRKTGATDPETGATSQSAGDPGSGGPGVGGGVGPSVGPSAGASASRGEASS